MKLGDILATLGERGTALVLLLFSLPAIVPTPGVPAGMIFGSALALLSLQMIFGAKGFKVPPFMARIVIGQKRLLGFVEAAAPKIEKLERRLRSRWIILTSAKAQRLPGLIVFVMSVLVALPIPFGNLVPGLAIFLIALGLAEKDGFAVGAGLGLAALAVAFSASVFIGGSWVVENLSSRMMRG